MSSIRKYVLLALVAVGTLAVAGVALAATAQLGASMNGTKETPAGDPNGAGTATIKTNSKTGRVCYAISLKRVGTVNAGHIHKGSAGKAGAVVVPLFAKATKQPKGCVSGVSKSLIRSIERSPSKYYVNVHNQAYPAGAVRGQLKKD